VYFNIIKAVRMILDELEYDFSNASETTKPSEEIYKRLQELRLSLLPLVAIEDQLASELNGGISISGRSGVFVRSGWQALVTPTRSRPVAVQPAKEAVIALAARTLYDLQEQIQSLWQHPYVTQLLSLRKAKLDESAPL
jgi:guanine nucleotide-binding protein subunit alpha